MQTKKISFWTLDLIPVQSSSQMKNTPGKNPLQELLTVSQAAARLKVTRQNIHDAIARGRLKASRVGSVMLITRASLDSYSKSRQRTGRPPKKK
jgi:excisionase family DNA binding protein